MKKVAFALRDEDAKKNTQKRIAARLGVSQKTVSVWFAEKQGRNIPKNNASQPDAKR